jgi:1,4-alpha-glucan branching enzyme
MRPSIRCTAAIVTASSHFSFVYAWSENFILPLSHDEVVHGKRSLLEKMPGDDWQKRANFRLTMSYTCVHPGKKLSFMGNEFGQRREWRNHDQLDWYLRADAAHESLRECVRTLNHWYLSAPQLHGSDCDADGFRWLDVDNAEASVWAFERRSTGGDRGAPIICLFNATPVPRDGYRVGVPEGGEYRKLFDSDARQFGGSGYNKQGSVSALAGAARGHAFTIEVDLPPLGAVFFGRP